MNRCTQRNRERRNSIRHAILSGLAQGDRNRCCRGRGSQSGQVRREHGEDGLEGVDAANRTGNKVLREQNDYFQHQNNDNYANQGSHDVNRFAGVGEVQEDAKDVQGQKRNDDVLDQAGDDRAELNKALAQNAPGHQGQANADDEGQQERGHHADDRRHFDGEVGLEDFLRSFDLSELPNKNLREEVGADSVGQEARKHCRGVGQSRSQTQPVACPLTQVSDCRGHQADDDERN